MNTQEMMEKLIRHPILRTNTGLQMQLGLPYLEKRRGKLCATFFPHREDFRDGNIEFYTPQYKITWVYPFEQIIFFENSLYYAAPNLSQPVKCIPIDRYAERGRLLIKDLYTECSTILKLYERDKTVSDVTLRKYQNAYIETLQALDLTGIYGEGNG